jgi:serine/threonine-protein kinase
MLTPGTRVGPYEIATLIGVGGMGEVYRARDSRLRRDVAVKIIATGRAADPGAVDRFTREAQAVAALSHPHIVAIYDVGAEGDVIYAVMELLDGESLKERIGREGVPRRRALEMAAAIAEGLAAAHGKGLAHRDLKPANVFITRDGHVKILDFGLAVPMAVQPWSETRPSPAGDTQSAPGAGTIGYMAPEQIRGGRSDARSDIFAFGCVLFEMLTGRRAFPGATPAEVTTAILRKPPAELDDEGVRIPSPVAAVVHRCLEKDPEQRFQSARDLAFALRGLLTDSIDRAPAKVEAGSTTRRGVHAIVLPGTAALALAIAALFAAGKLPARFFASDPALIRSVAVLPLVDRSQEGTSYFADGLTDELIATLGRVAQLRVTSRTSVMSYKATTKRLPQIAKELGVDAVVEGSIVREGERVKITVDLVDPGIDSRIWSDVYERDVRDIISAQSEIAAEIARRLAVEVTAEDRARLAGGRRVDPAAYDEYVKGRYYYNQRSAHDLQRAIDHFRRAIDFDPTYASAYAGLADAYSLIGYQNYLAPRETFPRAAVAAKRAADLDGRLADAHASLGYVLLYYEWDFAAAEAEFKRAIELNPNLVPARHFYSILLTALLRPAEARVQIERAHSLDPLSPLIASDMGFELYYAQRYDDAARVLRDAIAMSPRAAAPRFWLGRVLQAQEKYPEALAEYLAGGPDLTAWPPSLAGVGHLHGLLGDRRRAIEVLSTLDAMAERGFVSAYTRALVHLGLGDNLATFESLDRALEERSNWMVWLLRDPRWDPVRVEARFASILDRVGFPDEARARALTGR